MLNVLRCDICQNNRQRSNSNNKSLMIFCCFQEIFFLYLRSKCTTFLLLLRVISNMLRLCWHESRVEMTKNWHWKPFTSFCLEYLMRCFFFRRRRRLLNVSTSISLSVCLLFFPRFVFFGCCLAPLLCNLRQLKSFSSLKFMIFYISHS